MQKFRSLLYILLCFSPYSLVAQVADTIDIEAVEVKGFLPRGTTQGAITQSWSTTNLEKLPATNLAELLAQEAGVYIKSYGLGSLATSSVRGGSAGHTLVLWNGIPIQSPMLGLLDLSLLPISFSESISLQKGGNGANWGSGAIGGTISLKNETDYQNKFSLSNTSN